MSVIVIVHDPKAVGSSVCVMSARAPPTVNSTFVPRARCTASLVELGWVLLRSQRTESMAATSKKTTAHLGHT